MKKYLYLILSLFFSTNVLAGVASSIVPLSTGGGVAPMANFTLSLNGLAPTANYSVVCYITTSFPFQYILLSSSFTDTTSVVTSYSLNGNYVTQAQLAVGSNVVVINGRFTNPATGNLIFSNLDQTNSFTVGNCFGIPIG